MQSLIELNQQLNYKSCPSTKAIWCRLCSVCCSNQAPLLLHPLLLPLPCAQHFLYSDNLSNIIFPTILKRNLTMAFGFICLDRIDKSRLALVVWVTRYTVGEIKCHLWVWLGIRKPCNRSVKWKPPDQHKFWWGRGYVSWH